MSGNFLIVGRLRATINNRKSWGPKIGEFAREKATTITVQ